MSNLLFETLILSPLLEPLLKKAIKAIIASFKEGIKKEAEPSVMKGIPSGAAEMKEIPFNPMKYAKVGKFVTCNQGLGDEIVRIKHSIDQYVRRNEVSRPLNILLAAPPGSGKSFLIKQLAAALSNDKEIVFDEYQLGAMSTIDDLRDIFRRIQSYNISGKIPVVFLDEIDAEVANEPMYRHLLAPMADGKFYYKGSTNYLGKVVLAFAGSKGFAHQKPSESSDHDSSSEIEAKQIDASKEFLDYAAWSEQQLKLVLNSEDHNGNSKLSDFLDRIDILLFIPSLKTNLIDWDLDSEVLAMSLILIQKHFKYVTKVEVAAASTIMTILLGSDSKRHAESVVFLSETPAETTFHFSYLPERIRQPFDAEVKDLLGKYYILES